jgi:hypothetical protein
MKIRAQHNAFNRAIWALPEKYRENFDVLNEGPSD